jgi:hypothetical protein
MRHARLPLLLALAALAALALGAPSGTASHPCSNEIVGTESGEALTGTPASDRIRGLGGDDGIDGREGDDCIEAGDGADYVTGDLGNDEIDGGAGNDELEGLDGSDTFFGALGDDLVRGDDGNDAIDGGDGADTLLGFGDDDSIEGGPGNDDLAGGTGGDLLDGDDGDDRLEGETDFLLGFDLLSADGRDRLLAGAGDDRIGVGSGRSNAVEAGPGADRISSANGRRDAIDCGTGRDFVRADRSDRLRGCERVQYLRSPFPRVTPRSGGRFTRYVVSFRALVAIGRGQADTNGYVVRARGPRGPGCDRAADARTFRAVRRNQTLRFPLGPPRRGWCPGRYTLTLVFEEEIPDCEDSGEETTPCESRFTVARTTFRVR